MPDAWAGQGGAQITIRTQPETTQQTVIKGVVGVSTALAIALVITLLRRGRNGKK